MPDLEFFVVANSVSVDQATNRISVFEILDEIRPPRFPIALMRVVTISAWHVSEEEMGQDFQIRLLCTAPDEKPFENRSNFTAKNRMHRVLVGIVGIPLRKDGQIEFEVFLNDVSKAHHRILVEQQPNSERVDPIFVALKERPRLGAASSTAKKPKPSDIDP
jgi:hypothetical protein